MSTELLANSHDAINKAIADDETIADFRKRFDVIVKKHGWSYKGSRGWRTGVIFHTNLGVAYSTGEYAYAPKWLGLQVPGRESFKERT